MLRYYVKAGLQTTYVRDAIEEQLEKTSKDPKLFVRSLDDPEATGGRVIAGRMDRSARP
jgi:hypothetical protein